MNTTGVTDVIAAPATENPFPGLRPFQEGEEHLFFGREHQIDSMVDKLARTRFLAVIGTSGSGKSSLVNCGLRPALHRGLMTSAGHSWRTVYFRPGGAPIRALATALATELYENYSGEIPLAEVVETHLRMSSRGLVDVVRKARLPERTNLLLVADQFEELFRYRAAILDDDEDDGQDTAEEAIALVNLLLETVRHALPIYVVLTMRSDFLGDCSRFHGLPEVMNEGQYLVPRLSREERRAAIAGPITVADAEPHPALLTRLVNDVGDNPDQLSILQHALNRTWARWRVRRDPERPILIDDYTDIGTMAEALDRHAEKAFAELPDERYQQICERMFRALTDRGTDARGVRRPQTVARLCAITGATREELSRVIDVFRKPSRSFLMPPLPEALTSDTVVDISHESLMRVWRRLAQWTEWEARSARMYRRLVESAALHEEGKASLWRDPELQLATRWRHRQQPTPDWAELYDGRYQLATAFLERSLLARDVEMTGAELQRRWQRIRLGAYALAGAVSLSALLLVFPRVQSSLVPTAGAGITSTLRSIPDIAPALLLILGAMAAPFLLVYLLAEHFVRPLYFEQRFDAVSRKIALERDEALSIAEVRQARPEPNDRWKTTYAPVHRRALAFLIDGLIAFALLFVAMAIAAIVEGTPAEVPMADAWVTAGLLLGLLFGWVYQAAMLRAPRQATYGMRAAGLFVTTTKGDPVSFARATLRHACKALNFFYGLGLLLQLVTKRRQALHDWLSGTVVLSRPAASPAAIPIHEVHIVR